MYEGKRLPLKSGDLFMTRRLYERLEDLARKNHRKPRYTF